MSNAGIYLLLAAAFGPLMTWLVNRRDQRRKDRLDPVAVYSAAIKASSEGLTDVVSTLQGEIKRLEGQIATLTSANLALTAENAALRAEVGTLTGEVASLRTFVAERIPSQADPS